MSAVAVSGSGYPAGRQDVRRGGFRQRLVLRPVAGLHAAGKIHDEHEIEFAKLLAMKRRGDFQLREQGADRGGDEQPGGYSRAVEPRRFVAFDVLQGWQGELSHRCRVWFGKDPLTVRQTAVAGRSAVCPVRE